MKNLLDLLGKMLDGRKSWIAIAMVGVVFVNQLVQVLTNHPVLPQGWDEVILMLATAFGIAGISHKNEKAKAAAKEVGEAVVAVRDLLADLLKENTAVSAEAAQKADEAKKLLEALPVASRTEKGTFTKPVSVADFVAKQKEEGK